MGESWTRGSGRETAGGPLLQAEGLACERGERRLFAGLDLALGPGDCLHVAGDNGAGKTSLLRILAGLLPATEGCVRWRGRDVRASREEFGAELAYVGHLNGIKDELTVLENVRLAAALRGSPSDAGAAASAIERVGLGGFAQCLVRELSQGQKRRVALTRLCALPCEPLWILDEPFNALDASSVQWLRAHVEAHLARGGLAVLTAHQPVELPAGARRLELATPEGG